MSTQATVFQFEHFNPDGMTIQEVEAWRDYLGKTELQIIAIEISKQSIAVNYYECSRAALHCWLYCETKARAMHYRLQGQIENALRCEEVCGLIYNRLPEPIRW